jgi:hypothetical protein
VCSGDTAKGNDQGFLALTYTVKATEQYDPRQHNYHKKRQQLAGQPGSHGKSPSLFKGAFSPAIDATSIP